MLMKSLHALFTPGVLLRDADGDGIPDGVAAALHVADDLESCTGAVDVAARLGLESTGLTLPLVEGEGEFPVHIGPGLLLADGTSLAIGVGLAAAHGSGLIGPGPDGGLVVTGADPRGAGIAARYLAARYPYLRRVGDGAPVVPEGTTALLVDEGGVIAIRLGGDWQLVGDAEERGADAVHTPAASPVHAPAEGARLTTLDDLFTAGESLTLVLHPGLTLEERKALIDFAARLGVESTSLRFPLVTLTSDETASASAREGAGMKPDGLQPPLRLDVVPQSGAPRITLSPSGVTVAGAAALRYLATATDLVDLRQGLTPEPGIAAEEPYAEMTYQGEWEVDRFWRLWREEVLPALSGDTPVTVDLRLSEPLSVRLQIKADLTAQLPAGSTVAVRSCFKQGLHWIMEEVLPELKGLGAAEASRGGMPREAGPIARIVLQFRRFTGKAPDGEKVLELPHRWLQECYPADALLARELRISEDDVAFVMVEEGPTYTLTAYDAAGEPLKVFTYQAQTGLRRYLDAFPERGWVHPPSGSLEVNGRFFGSLPTDVEQFWDWYQSAVLPKVRELSVSQHGGKPTIEAQPLFGTLRIEVKMSESDERLGIREEHISPLDALHEDLYFVTLDYLATWGRSLHGVPFSAPGMVLPFIAPAGVGEPPQAWVTLTRRQPSRSVPAPAPIIGLMLGDDGQPARVDLGDGRSLPVPPPLPSALDQATPVDTISLEEVIGPDQLPANLAYLRRLPGVKVWPAGRSYLGRPCYAVELRLPVPERIQPPRKASAFKPVLLINARHHANEVSSTNSALKLVERAATGDPELTRFLRGANVVLNPLENMDGAATHQAMMADHPTWKLHSARFNAVGLEYYGQYAVPDTPYGEARVLPALFQLYQPDVVLDDHGVPSHEWLQPFAGYSSAPYFRVSYWLPNALIYGIFRDLDPERYPHQVAATKALRTILTGRVRAGDVYEENQMWLRIYRKWGTDWAPEMFPVELHDGMICYTWPAGPQSFSVLFPEVCVVDWVTEVPDETAQGGHLRRTAEAHLVGDTAALEFLARHPQPVEHTAVTEGDGVRWRVGRVRPFRTVTDYHLGRIG